MTNPRTAVIIGCNRDTRFADQRPARCADLDFEVLDLRDVPLPLFTEVTSNACAPTQNEVGRCWQRRLVEFDGYVLITAEYDHGSTAALETALDYAYPEWNKKPLAFVEYGLVGAARDRAAARQRGGVADGATSHGGPDSGRRLLRGDAGRTAPGRPDIP